MKDRRQTARLLAARPSALTVLLPLVLILNCGAEQPRFSLSYPSWVGAVVYSRDGKLLAVGVADGATRILRASDGHESSVLRGHADAVTSVAFTPDGKMIVTGSFDQTARLWEVVSAKARATFHGHQGAVMSVAISPDGQTLATSSIDTSIKLWDLSIGTSLATLSGHKSWVNSIVFSGDGRHLFSGSSDGTVKIWDLAPREAEATLDATTTAGRTPPEIRSLVLSPDGNTVAAGLRYGTVKLWTGPSWHQTRSFKAHDGDVWTVAFNSKGTALITGDGDWNRPGQAKFWDAATGALLGQRATSGEVLALACSPDGRQIAVGCWNNHVEVWNTP
jgi:WD40 repeat protein